MQPTPARDRAAIAAAAILGVIRRELSAWVEREPADLRGVRAEIEAIVREFLEGAP
jgi:hypothetical protein